MASEQKLKEAFRKVKEDIEGTKNELAFALRRIAKIEESMNRQALEKLARKSLERKSEKRKAKKKAGKKKKL